jgi:hypothetical protein
MPAEQIARNLAFVNWTVLAGLAVGAFGAVVLLHLRTDATKGYLGFTALCAAAFAGLAWLSDGALPVITGAGSPIIIDATWDLPRADVAGAPGARLLRVRYCALPGRARPMLGIGALAAGALTWGGGTIGAVQLVLAITCSPPWTPPRGDAVAVGWELAPPPPAENFHLQATAHAGRTTQKSGRPRWASRSSFLATCRGRCLLPVEGTGPGSSAASGAGPEPRV